MYRKTSLLTAFILGICTVLSAQQINHRFPEEKLSERIEKIKEIAQADITFDRTGTSSITIEALHADDYSLAKVIELSLKGTGYSCELQNNTYIIYRDKNQQQRQPSSPGALKGRIVEAESSEPLPGATVKIAGTNLVTMTDLDGYYNFSKVASGRQTLEVSFIGYAAEKTEIRIQPNRSSTHDIKLSPDSKQLSEVVVSGVARTRSSVPHATEKLVVQEIKGLSVVASGISSEQIGKSADRNAAQAVQRVAGVSIVDDKFVIVRGLNPRYNLTYLNDNVAPSTEMYSRSFALDLIPSRVIDKILVQKSPSPENQADATGGVIKVYTKNAKAVKHFDIDFQLGILDGTAFNNNFLAYQGGKYDFLGFDDGTRGLPSTVPGFGVIDRSVLSQKEYIESFTSILTYGKKTALPNMQFTANYYDAWNVFGKTLSSLTSLNYKNERMHADVHRQQGVNDGNYLTTDNIQYDNRNTETAQVNLLQNFSLHLNDSSYIRFNNFILQQGQSTTLVKISQRRLADSKTRNKDNILNYTQRSLYMGNLQGAHYSPSGRQKLEWNVGYTYSRQDVPDQRVMRFRSPGGNSTGNPELQWRARGRTVSDNSSTATIPLSVGIISRLWSQNTEAVYNASLDYTHRLTRWLSFHAGTFHQWKEREVYRRIFTVHEGDVTGQLSDYYTPVGGYGGYINPDLVRFREQELANVWSTEYFREDGNGLKVMDKTAGSDAYVASEQNNSGYLAARLMPFGGKVELYGGLRVEYNRQRISAAIPPANIDGINVPILIDNPVTSWLPSLNLSWRLTDSWVFRGAYGKTVNRWEFREASPYSETDYENNQTIGGNPNLKSAEVENYDLRVEFYPKSGGSEAVSLGVFYKSIINPIERIVNSSRTMSLLPSISFENGEKAFIQGIELEVRKDFSFIPGAFFRNLSASANISLIKSEVRKDSTSYGSSYKINRPLQGQAPYIINAGLYYDNAAWGSKISLIYNIVGTRIYAASTEYRYKQ